MTLSCNYELSRSHSTPSSPLAGLVYSAMSEAKARKRESPCAEQSENVTSIGDQVHKMFGFKSVRLFDVPGALESTNHASPWPAGLGVIAENGFELLLRARPLEINITNILRSLTMGKVARSCIPTLW